jgi:hypothetical protein
MIVHLRRLCAGVVVGLATLGAAGTEAATLFVSDRAGRLAAERPGLDSQRRSLDLSGHALCGNTGTLSTNVGTFARTGGPAGSGSSICGDTSAPQVKDGTLRNLYGRFNPFPVETRWIDSNDLTDVDWVIDTVALGLAPLAGLEFALIDAHDQPLRGYGPESFFHMFVNGIEMFSIPERQPNANVIWLTLLFDEPVDRLTISFLTRHNDGYGIAADVSLSPISVPPIPLPPAALLLVGSVLLLVRVRGSRAAA